MYNILVTKYEFGSQLILDPPHAIIEKTNTAVSDMLCSSKIQKKMKYFVVAITKETWASFL